MLTGMVPFTELNVADPGCICVRTVGEDRIAVLYRWEADRGANKPVLLVAMVLHLFVFYSMQSRWMLPKRLSSVHKRLQTPLF
ncbi:hypothetical protein CW304_10020 [Bacillus sp. UFRGS-B20]|nr:hypothetical protein CW304_10020 [Bacillus sp. UFRGS-B20]